MTDESQDKQHQATGKHIADLRKRGNVMRSRDLSGGLILIVGVILILILSEHLMINIKRSFIISFTSFNEVSNNHYHIFVILNNLILSNFLQLLPILIVLMISIFISPFLFGGWNFSLESLHFNFDKLNPIKNLSKIFSPKYTAIEIIKSLIKSNFFLMILVLYFFVKKNEIVNMINMPVFSAIQSSTKIVIHFVVILSFSSIFIVLFDLIYNYFRYQNQAKMSTQELKDEHKESEGSPEAKRRQRSKQVALVQQRLNQLVPKASVVITNPTHYAIALRYDNGKDHAPKVIAKGKDVIAHQIRKIAIAHAVAIYEAPPLARAIYHTTKIGAPIHPALYKAVAIVLSYVYQLKNYQMGSGVLPEFVSHLEIPEEFVYDE